MSIHQYDSTHLCHLLLHRYYQRGQTLYGLYWNLVHQVTRLHLYTVLKCIYLIVISLNCVWNSKFEVRAEKRYIKMIITYNNTKHRQNIVKHGKTNIQHTRQHHFTPFEEFAFTTLPGHCFADPRPWEKKKYHIKDKAGISREQDLDCLQSATSYDVISSYSYLTLATGWQHRPSIKGPLQTCGWPTLPRVSSPILEIAGVGVGE